MGKNTRVLSTYFHPKLVRNRQRINSRGLLPCPRHRLSAFLLLQKALSREARVLDRGALGLYMDWLPEAAGDL